MTLLMYAALSIICFAAGGLVVWLFVRKAEKKESQIQGCQKKGIIARIGVMNFILIILGISIVLFVLKMINLFEQYGSIPDSLVTCFFAVVGGECGAMAWIRTTKDAKRAREWQLQDEERFNQKTQ